jgi:KDO2-lipid IV(A) lauroyltransferase
MATASNKLNLWQKAMLETLWIMCRGLAIMPDFLRHGIFTNFIYLIICYVVRYRRKVMMDNLRRSFPNASEKELNKICRKAYYNLAEQVINTLSQAGISDEELLHRMELPNIEQIRREMGGKSAVFMMGHYGPWEAGLAVSIKLPEQRLVAVYHKLTSPVIDELLKRIRQRPNVDLVDMKRTIRHFIDNKDKQPMIIGLISDQNPPYRANMPWFKFLHQWSAFFDGAEMIATKYKLPVYYFSPRRVRAGHYVGIFKLIHDGVEPIEPNTITERFVRMVEEDIVKYPELWMWSHRRWKHTPPAELLAQKI